ncbi:MAG: hypothetical protein NZ825_14070 [Candidatus Marinimicrobia bacterium]|nr:hypothetical protein [Candidatus Neomarinimicrobiota bacterium]
MAKKASVMRILILPIVAVFTVGLFASSDVFAQDTEFVIPNWVKDVAKYWYENNIDDDTFIGTLKYLIQHEILILPDEDAARSTQSEIPTWVKNTAGWWADDQIDDETFVNALQYLIKVGIIQVKIGGGGASGGGY